MNHIFLIDTNLRRRRALGLVLTSVGGYQISTFSSVQHLPPLSSDDVLLIAHDLINETQLNTTARIISFGQSDVKCGNICYLKILEYPAFAEQVRQALQD